MYILGLFWDEYEQVDIELKEGGDIFVTKRANMRAGIITPPLTPYLLYPGNIISVVCIRVTNTGYKYFRYIIWGDNIFPSYIPFAHGL